MTGFGHRESNWEFSAGVQHEVLPRVSLDVGYFRRIWLNLQTTDNLAVSADDFDTFSMVVPSDPRLPNGGGYRLEGLRNFKPSAFGRPEENYNTLATKYGRRPGPLARMKIGMTCFGVTQQKRVFSLYERLRSWTG